MQKKVNIKSSTVPGHHGDHLHEEKCRDKVQHNIEHSGDHLHVEEGEDQVKPNPAHHDAHLHAEEGEESQSPPRTACGSPA